jgi:hypothetical protein
MKQKNEEKLVLQYFRKSFPGFPKGRLIPSESPDFILRISPKKSIGIELTELYHSGNLISEIRMAVKKKEEKLPAYRHMNLSQQWLIIHADDVEREVNYHFRNKLGNMELNTSFDRVFLFDLSSGKIVKLGG